MSWIPVTARLPEIGVDVLVFGEPCQGMVDGRYICTARLMADHDIPPRTWDWIESGGVNGGETLFDEDGFMRRKEDGAMLGWACVGYVGVTHWMPLPEDPE